MGKVERFLRGYVNLCLDHGLELQGRGAEDWGGEWMDLCRIDTGEKMRTVSNDFLKEFKCDRDDEEW